MDDTKLLTVPEILKSRFQNSRPLDTIYFEDIEELRLNLVTDDISKKSLFGGVATSIIFATLLCHKNNWPLRLITRNHECNLHDYYRFVNIQKLTPPDKVEAYSDCHQNNPEINYKLPLGKNEVFFATSWWSAKAILDTQICKRIIYMIQEEETFFYPYGDDRYLCWQIMNDDRIDFIVNSKLLYDYFYDHGYQILCQNGIWFEPAFPKHFYYANTQSFQKTYSEKRKLFFYGRPVNPRNLFYLGIDCLNDAVSLGIIDTDLWDIYLAGYDVEAFQFSNGYIPEIKGAMTWEEYADFARTVDVAFSLMYTPHPSYPPLDMLCSGAVVLTNEFENKKSLSYSSNMIIKKLEKKELLDGLQEAILLSENHQQREQNYINNKICQSWDDSFLNVLSLCETQIKEKRYV
jgi:hypothetical protein